MFKVRETLLLQDLFRQLCHPNVRNDFVTGRNGAVKLDVSDLALVDKLVAEGFVSLEDVDSDDALVANAHRAADHWVSTVDGKPKQFAMGVTYERVRQVVRSIQDSGYFQQRFAPANSPTTSEQTATLSEGTASTTSTCDTVEGQATDNTTTTDTVPSVDIPKASSMAPIPNPPNTIKVQNTVLGNGAVVTAVVPHHVSVSDNVALRVCPEQTTSSWPKAIHDPNSLPEELQSGSFTFLQDSELEAEQHGQHQASMSRNVIQVIPSTPSLNPQCVYTNNGQQQVAPPQSTSLLLINPMIPLPGMTSQVNHSQVQQTLVDRPPQPLVNEGSATGAAAVTPPMFPFPFQAVPAGLGQAPLPVNGQAGGNASLNPFQQLVKTLNYNQLIHLNGGGQSIPPMEGSNERACTNIEAPAQQPAGAAVGSTATESGAQIAQERNSGPAGTLTGTTTPSTSAHDNATEEMTISEWNPVGPREGTEIGQQEKNNDMRDMSADSSCAGRDRRRHEDRRNHRGSNGENGTVGGYNGGGRRRGGYLDRSSVHSNGGGSGSFNNGSRLHRNGGDGETMGGALFRGGVMSKGHQVGSHTPHQRMNGGGGGGATNGSSSGGSGTVFYRNNEPNYYQQNGVKSSGMRHSQGGFKGHGQQHQPQQANGGRVSSSRENRH